MTDIRARIDAYLNSPGLAANIDAMFTDPTCLGWGATHASPQLLDVKAPVAQRIRALPIARMGAIPVYRVEWPGDRLPTMTQRRAMHRALTPVAIEHLICYVTSDARQAAFVWARNRGRGSGKGQNTELRTLPFEVGSPARTTIDQLAELAFTPQDLGLFGEPPAGKVLAKAGFFAVILKFLVAAKKLLIVGAIALGAGIKAFFSRKKSTDVDDEV